MRRVKKKRNTGHVAEMQEEYDFSGGVRGKYVERYKEGSNVVVLDPDVAKEFPDSESVNRSLRDLARIIRRRRKVTSGKKSG
jgi:hypothetical protein